MCRGKGYRLSESATRIVGYCGMCTNLSGDPLEYGNQLGRDSVVVRPQGFHGGGVGTGNINAFKIFLKWQYSVVF
jgi:hypothetical protein